MANASYNLKDLPGKHSNTTLLLAKNTGYSFLIEAIDKGIFEFTICMYDNEDDMNRHEYVLTCNKKSLSDLKKCIDTVLK
jgi:hypothetical protein